MARSKLFRYRRPSLCMMLSVTRVKRRFKSASGYYAATRWMRAYQFPPPHAQARATTPAQWGFCALFGRR